MMKILLAEDDIDLGNVLAQFLELNNYDVVLARDGNDALSSFKMGIPDICIFDVMMPGLNGFELARQIKKKNIEVPIIFLTAKNQKQDIITGLKIGADDYITKPFEVEELLLRIQNILKRSNKIQPEILEVSGLSLNMDGFRLKTTAGIIQLTEKEAELIRFFLCNKNEMVRRETILTKFWGENDYFMGRSLDVFINRIRKYLQNEPEIKLVTVRGVGYILEVG